MSQIPFELPPQIPSQPILRIPSEPTSQIPPEPTSRISSELISQISTPARHSTPAPPSLPKSSEKCDFSTVLKRDFEDKQDVQQEISLRRIKAEKEAKLYCSNLGRCASKTNGGICLSNKEMCSLLVEVDLEVDLEVDMEVDPERWIKRWIWRQR
ncbi:hypothetical protein L211DRAFT_883897 [Terfezia boudieri ATCC MYA-4762]|uniref:Uncharacterized protein n=1 Tax=Terfezia boudieri ATCC MYA-4762 TaxID=1051890 RepID=A0A3N4LIR3_9PEZI|nr:hypothetical protein L211DRAFT_883897 [Terfezia boudieri ATCC MYA-4762]